MHLRHSGADFLWPGVCSRARRCHHDGDRNDDRPASRLRRRCRAPGGRRWISSCRTNSARSSRRRASSPPVSWRRTRPSGTRRPTSPARPSRRPASLGFCGLYTREDFGGLGLPRLDATLVFEELAAACPSTTAFITIHNMVTWMVTTFAQQDVAERWGPLLASGRKLGSYCLTEPGPARTPRRWRRARDATAMPTCSAAARRSSRGRGRPTCWW